MSTFIVSNTNDQGKGSLRDALAKAEQHSGVDTIVFNANLAGQTIFLASTLQIRSGSVIIKGDINGDGDPDITISGDTNADGQDASDVGTLLTIANGATARIAALVFTDGYSVGASSSQAGVAGERGMAGIVNKGNLTLSDSIVQNMIAIGGLGGGDATDTDEGAQAFAGIENTGTLTISDSYIAQNSATGAAADNAIDNAGAGGLAVAGIHNKGQLNADGVLFKGNAAVGGPGGQSTNYTGGDGGAADSSIWQDAGYTGGYIGFETGTAIGGAFGTGNPGPGENGKNYVGFHAETGSTSNLVSSNEAASNHFGTQSADTVYITNGQNFFGLHGADRIDNRGLDVAGITVRGGSGNDTIYTGTSDTTYGGTGSDTIHAQGNASVDAGQGNDTVYVAAISAVNTLTAIGGGGTDTLDFSLITGQDLSMNLGTGQSSGAATFSGFERVVGIDDAGYSDQLTGSSAANFIDGRAGNDILKGKNGNDTLRGGAGHDLLDGGRQNDRLTGGTEDDIFAFAKRYAKDVILDFADNVDSIALNSNLWRGTLSARQVLKQFATLKHNGDVVLDFGHGDVLTVKHANSIHALQNDLTIV
ncbi:MAG: hypothetical protein H6873_11705 [Hyphomicrobiaceae bacterium]|nr:hypothetical protein [Hyphomicrobiaceae bacterium]